MLKQLRAFASTARGEICSAGPGGKRVLLRFPSVVVMVTLVFLVACGDSKPDRETCDRAYDRCATGDCQEWDEITDYSQADHCYETIADRVAAARRAAEAAQAEAERKAAAPHPEIVDCRWRQYWDAADEKTLEIRGEMRNNTRYDISSFWMVLRIYGDPNARSIGIATAGTYPDREEIIRNGSKTSFFGLYGYANWTREHPGMEQVYLDEVSYLLDGVPWKVGWLQDCQEVQEF